jgi:cytochrome c oxidase subunit II
MSHIQSVLYPSGIQAARINHVWWVMLVVCTIVWVLVAAATLLAVARGRKAASTATDGQLTVIVGIAGGVTIVVLIGLLFDTIVIGRSLETLRTPDALRIQVTGYQWWWDVQYENPVAGLRVTTANELHIPVGRPVAIDLLSSDVIHSFWVPNLQGKIDLVPGRKNELWLQADTPGIYRGQCAEYCGAQHAHMALLVTAEPEEEFQRWLTANRASAPLPQTPEQIRGRDVIERGPCAMCHAVQGTAASARMGPDLTHVASRSTLGAGTVPNTRGYLAGWIMDPQHIKPGNHMPPTGLRDEELQAVLAYLETLK